MLAAGRFPRRDGSLPVWRRLESPAFRADPGAAGFGGLDGLAPGSPLRDLVEAARTSSAPPPVLLDAGGAPLRAEAHYNRHAFLVLLSRPQVAVRPRG
jgi:hypothetical protein